MRRRRSFGLRPRLLAALVFTAAVTLGVAALALLPPLQSRLTDEASTSLEQATQADVGFFEQQIERGFKQLARENAKTPKTRAEWLDPFRTFGAFDLNRRATTLRDRTGARVIVVDSVPGERPIADTDFATSPLPEREILHALATGIGRTVRRGNDVIVTQVISVPKRKG